jgi:hypothetical protein
VSVSPADEAPHAPAEPPDPAFIDALTFAFGDPRAELYGLARLAIGAEGASGMAIIYEGHEPVAGGRQVGVPLEADDGAPTWESASAAGVRTTVETPLEAWTVSYAAQDGAGFELRFEATSAPAEIDADSAAARAAGMHGYEQTASVSGSVTHGGRTVKLSCLGQRGHLWGAPQLERIELARTLSAWLGADRALALTAVRPARAKQHQLDEALVGFVVEGGEPRPIADPRLSTTYDAGLRQQRAGLELWMDAEGTIGRRAWGEMLCGTTIELGDMRLDSAFFGWRMEGREGVGLYDVLRRDDGKRAGR